MFPEPIDANEFYLQMKNKRYRLLADQDFALSLFRSDLGRLSRRRICDSIPALIFRPAVRKAKQTNPPEHRNHIVHR